MLLSSRYQEVFALLVPSCCNKSGTRLLSSCYKLVNATVRLSTICFNNTNTGCSLQVCPSLITVINLLTTCYVRTITDLLEQLVSSLLASSTLLPNFFQTFQKLCKQKCEHIFLARKIESEIESIQRRALRIFPEHK